MTKEKQFRFDTKYLRMARIWAENSYAERRKVGCLIVKDNMIICINWAYKKQRYQ